MTDPVPLGLVEEPAPRPAKSMRRMGETRYSPVAPRSVCSHVAWLSQSKRASAPDRAASGR